MPGPKVVTVWIRHVLNGDVKVTYPSSDRATYILKGPDKRYLQEYNQWKPHSCVNINCRSMEQIDFGRRVRDKMMIVDIEGEDLMREVKEEKQEDKKKKQQEDEATRRKRKLRSLLNTRRVNTKPKPTAKEKEKEEGDQKRAVKAAATEEKKALEATKKEAKAAAEAAAEPKAAMEATRPKAKQRPTKRTKR